MDFRQRLQKAASRGARSRAEREFEEAAEAISEEECRRLHSRLRLALTEHIEKCLAQLADNFPGFKPETIVDERGWGAAVSRDDVSMSGGRRNNLFSRLQVVVGPYNEYKVLDVSAKGAVHNKETFVRNHHQPLADVDEDHFRELIEMWILDYAEMYAAR
ncbi:hypothetical protein KOR34_42560 [Posidoniimonas corsicana]|uniref:Uncharacterized protein n=1 Tax=Posidoniimonas corsicana TaxID=1938618 RepID=A0A5C5V3G7_9BACT|nr:hypothetical protein [Posidoniimonas corsicana]TWT32493.1 hypothetical protein KOR34_42560 [Posidoniimonas corsicana]